MVGLVNRTVSHFSVSVLESSNNCVIHTVGVMPIATAMSVHIRMANKISTKLCTGLLSTCVLPLGPFGKSLPLIPFRNGS